MTIVKELNELAEKMTGTNPKATTDAQAWDYIEQNYQGGGGTPYVLPTASANTLGGIKVGDNLSIDGNGVLSATGGSSVEAKIVDITDGQFIANSYDEFYDNSVEYYEQTITSSEYKEAFEDAISAFEENKATPIYLKDGNEYFKSIDISVTNKPVTQTPIYHFCFTGLYLSIDDNNKRVKEELLMIFDVEENADIVFRTSITHKELATGGQS